MPEIKPDITVAQLKELIPLNWFTEFRIKCQESNKTKKFDYHLDMLDFLKQSYDQIVIEENILAIIFLMQINQTMKRLSIRKIRKTNRRMPVKH